LTLDADGENTGDVVSQGLPDSDCVAVATGNIVIVCASECVTVGGAEIVIVRSGDLEFVGVVDFAVVVTVWCGDRDRVAVLLRECETVGDGDMERDTVSRGDWVLLITGVPDRVAERGSVEVAREDRDREGEGGVRDFDADRLELDVLTERGAVLASGPGHNCVKVPGLSRVCVSADVWQSDTDRVTSGKSPENRQPTKAHVISPLPKPSLSPLRRKIQFVQLNECRL
jgi:hypothetical protein